MALTESSQLRIVSNHHEFQWKSLGSIPYMRMWTFEQGIASLEDRAYRYGRECEAPPLSPKSKLVHIALEEPSASPTTVLNRAPIYEDDEPPYSEHDSDDVDNEEMILDCRDKQRTRSSRASLSQCYSCGSACLDKNRRPSSKENAQWYIDVHNGVTRKIAYVFCWKCVDVFVKQLQRAPHAGCGHLPLLSLPECDEECQLMFCGRCRLDMGRNAINDGGCV